MNPESPADLHRHDDRAAALVDLAHESLSDARSATLMVEGIGRAGAHSAGVTLAVRSGRPVLFCPAHSTLAVVAADVANAVLAVPTPPTATPATVVFSGQLHCAQSYGIGRERTLAIELVPASIIVESDDGGRKQVDLARYTDNVRPPCRDRRRLSDAEFAQVAETIRVHTNTRHSGNLVRAVAELAAIAPHAVAGATLSAIDRESVLLEWTDANGGHRLPLSFTRPVEYPEQLAAAIRNALEDRR